MLRKLTYFEGVGPNITRVYNKQLVLDLGPHIVSLLESWFGLGPSNLHLTPANLGPASMAKQNPSWIFATLDLTQTRPILILHTDGNVTIDKGLGECQLVNTSMHVHSLDIAHSHVPQMKEA